MLVEVRRLVPALPGPVWRVLAVDLLSAVGSGLTLPFLVVYLHQARGLSLGAAGTAAACLAAAGLAGNPAGGWLADRVGPPRAVVVGLLTAAAGAVLLAAVSQSWHAYPPRRWPVWGWRSPGPRRMRCWPGWPGKLSGRACSRYGT